jgi:hypothetical protein
MAEKILRLLDGYVLHSHIMHSHVMHAHIMHSHAGTPMPCIESFTSELTATFQLSLEGQNGLSAA